MTKIRSNIVNSLGPDEAALLPDHVVSIDNGVIIGIGPYDRDVDADCLDRRDTFVLPGLIDLHVHLSQFRIRGIYRPALLPWLDEVVFPEEAKSADESYAAMLAHDFYQALLSNGTTSAVIYTAPFKSACDIAFRVAERIGIRAFIGMTMMDQNSPSALLQKTDDSLRDSMELFDRWDNANSYLKYIFTPRFAPTCSIELMRALGRLVHDRGAWLQTHLSENMDEINWVSKLFGRDSYTKVYEDMGLLGPRSIFGHAIHLSDDEISLLAATDSKIAHCPDSNFYLKSGEFPYQRIQDAGICVGIGSDVGAGTNLNMLHHAKMSNYRVSSFSLTPERMLYHITLGNAKLLQIDSLIGSIDTGKQADLVFYHLSDETGFSDSILSRLCFYGQEFKVVETMIAGRTVYRS